GTNVVIPNGSLDPWHALGKYTSNDPSVVWYLVNGTAHCADMYPPRAQDPPGLTVVRKLIPQNIDVWLSKAPSPFHIAPTEAVPWTKPEVNQPLESIPSAFKPAQESVAVGIPGVDQIQENAFSQASSWIPPCTRHGPESSRWVLNENITYLTWAKKFGATVYLLEHRYYGQSVVYGPNGIANEDLTYLSSIQMLHDVANFIRAVNAQQTTPPKWITFGGSYSGALSLWMREVFPEVVHGAVGSSAPVEAKLDFYGEIWLRLYLALRQKNCNVAKFPTVSVGPFGCGNACALRKCCTLRD
ncbi:hypothetical protein OSTOST_21294, partial [Ostertagia ostertagi]